MILQVEHLEKVYSGKVSHRALDDISMFVEEGEFIAIMGPSGSGKSTFLNTISTVDKPSGGLVFINGRDPHLLSDQELAKFRRKELGFVFQDFNLINTLTVEENIMLPLALDNQENNRMLEKVNELVHLLGIENILKKRTYEISGGQAQRVAVARAVINHPSLLLADEPTGNLDSRAAKDVMKLFQLLNDKMGITILMVTHDPNVASYSDKTYVIKDGSIFQELLKKDSRSTYYKEIMSTMSLLGGESNDFI
ncbi:ABC transporter ATP-binding protein [Streptococcus catagoni]|uniref:ABC transporter ATP-binding protein n=1 Tax=Streptococcus catagoni TaxID=2654874 RepID=UPI0014074A5C|nr:ABC transporter ATP-binding protein [Streptococcus catagoni]